MMGTPGWNNAAVRGPGGNIITVDEHQRLAAVAGAGGTAVLNPLNPPPALFGLFPGFVAPQASAATNGGTSGEGGKGGGSAMQASGAASVAPAPGAVPASGVRPLAAAGLPGTAVNNPALGIVGGGLRGNFLFSSVPASHASFLPRGSTGAESSGTAQPQQASGEGNAQAGPQKEGEQRALPEGCFRLLLPFGALSRTFFAPATAVAAGAAEDVSTPSAATPGSGAAVVGGQLHAVPGLGKSVVFQPQAVTSPSSFSTTASSPSVGKGKGHPVLVPAGSFVAQSGMPLASCAPLCAPSLGSGGSPTCSSASAGGASTVDDETQSRNGRGGSESSSASTSSSPASSRGVAGVGERAGGRPEEEGMKAEGGMQFECQAGPSAGKELAMKEEACGGVAGEHEATAEAGFGADMECSLDGGLYGGEAGQAREGDKKTRRSEDRDTFATVQPRGLSGSGPGQEEGFSRREEEAHLVSSGRTGLAGVRRRRSTSYSRGRAGNPSWLFSLVDCPDSACGGEGEEEAAAAFGARDLGPARDREDGKEDDDSCLSRGESREGFSRSRSYQFSLSSLSSSSLNSALFASGGGLGGGSFLTSPPPSPPVSPPVRCRPGFISSPSSNLGLGRALKRRCVDVSPLLLASPSTLFSSGLGSAEKKRWSGEARGAGVLEDMQGSSTSSSPLGARPCSLSPRPHAAGDKSHGAPGHVQSSPLSGRSRPYANFLASPPLETKKASASSICFSALPPSLTSLRQSESLLDDKPGASGTEVGPSGDGEAQSSALGRAGKRKKRDSLTRGRSGERRDEESEDEDAALASEASRRGQTDDGLRSEGREREGERFSLLPRRHNSTDDGKDELSSGLSGRTKSVLAYLSSPLTDILASPVFPIGPRSGDKSKRRRGPSHTLCGNEASLGGPLAGAGSSVSGSPAFSPSPASFLPFSPFSVPPRPSPPCGPSTFPVQLGSPSSPQRRSSGSGRRLVLLPQSAVGSSPGPIETGTPQLFSNSLPPVFSENLSVSPACFALASPSVTSSALLPPAVASAGAARPAQLDEAHPAAGSFSLSQPLAAASRAEARPASSSGSESQETTPASSEGFPLFQPTAGALAPSLPVLDLGGASAALQAAAKAAAAAAAASAASAAAGTRHGGAKEQAPGSDGDVNSLLAFRSVVPGWSVSLPGGAEEKAKAPEVAAEQAPDPSREKGTGLPAAEEPGEENEAADPVKESGGEKSRSASALPVAAENAVSPGPIRVEQQVAEERQGREPSSVSMVGAQGSLGGTDADSRTLAKKETPVASAESPTGVSVVPSGSQGPPRISVAAGVVA